MTNKTAKDDDITWLVSSFEDSESYSVVSELCWSGHYAVDLRREPFLLEEVKQQETSGFSRR